ncbi:MAG: bifunctional glycosyltransferase family 2/GtrA family protein [Clostridiales bacterium]|nr:bifunctional glycosyltransferase family 2/GtrA family protein [Clostridiales bacterium]
MENKEIQRPILIPIVIPSYEPDEKLIALLHDFDKKEMGPVVIVNDGSSEEYDHIFKEAASIIEKRGGKLISYRPNRGKGRALKTAFSYIAENMPDALGCVTADSDGQHTPDCINNIIDAFKAHPDNLIMGVRKFEKKDIPWKSWFGNTVTISVFSYVAGMRVSDTQSGLRGIPFRFMKELIDCKGERFEFEMQMLLECAGKYDLTEVPIKTIYESKDNHQTHFRPIKDSIRIYRILGKKFFKFVFASLSSFVIDILLFHLFVLLFKDTFSALYITFATVGARVISAVYNYLINYKFVFRSRASRAASLTKYALLAVIQMSLSAGLVSLVVFLIPNCPETPVKVVVDTLLFLLSYAVQQRFVFSSKSKNNLQKE